MEKKLPTDFIIYNMRRVDFVFFFAWRHYSVERPPRSSTAVVARDRIRRVGARSYESCRIFPATTTQHRRPRRSIFVAQRPAVGSESNTGKKKK